MDEELRAYLDAMRKEINDAQERLLNRVASLAVEFRNTRRLLAGAAIVTRRRDSRPGGR